MILKKVCVATVVAVALCAGSVPAMAQSAYSVSQGDKAIILPPGNTSGSKCTVGYNGSDFSYIAAHCGKDGYAVHLELPGGYTSPRVGTFYRSPAAMVDNGAANFNDWGVIRWEPSVNVGPNSYSGDVLVDPSTVTSGDTACDYGDTTRRISCGPFVGNLGKTFFVDEVVSNPGDSGGPMWIPGRGLVGIISGPDKASMQSWNGSWSVNVLRGAHPGVNDAGHFADQRVTMFSTWVRDGFVPKDEEDSPVVPSPQTPSTVPEVPTPEPVEPTPAPERPGDPWDSLSLGTARPGEDLNFEITFGPDFDSPSVRRLDPIMDEYEAGPFFKKRKAKAVSEVEPVSIGTLAVTPQEQSQSEPLPTQHNAGVIASILSFIQRALRAF